MRDATAPSETMERIRKYLSWADWEASFKQIYRPGLHIRKDAGRPEFCTTMLSRSGLKKLFLAVATLRYPVSPLTACPHGCPPPAVVASILIMSLSFSSRIRYYASEMALLLGLLSSRNLLGRVGNDPPRSTCPRSGVVKTRKVTTLFQWHG